MGRHAARISRSELAHKIVAVTGQTIEELIDDALESHELCNHPSIADDLKKVQFDLENFSCQEAYGFNPDALAKLIGLQYHFPLTFLGCNAGGDWECPIFFIIYWDGKKLRAYIPADGNSWSKKTKSAFGNHDDEPADDAPNFDAKKLLQDIKARITVPN